MTDLTLDHATRSIPKATLVSMALARREDGHALAKFGYVRQLGLAPGEVAAVRDHVASRPARTSPAADQHQAALLSDTALWDTLSAFEGAPVSVQLPPAGRLADVPVSTLAAFGSALASVRQSAVEELQRAGEASSPESASAGPLDAVSSSPPALGVAMNRLNLVTVSNLGLQNLVSGSPVGMLNLERLEMAPAGIERGGLLATIPLAPLEETAVVTKEWSVTSKEFTSIVTDSLENYSETGVTDNTELTQGTTSQHTHSNQFNITGTVSGGIPIISGQVSSGFGAQDSSSESATESRKHAVTLTQKASSRAKQEHKVTISTTTVTGASETTTRSLTNQSATDPMRIDYFSLLRKWRVRLYRYGLRLTYDVVIPEPGGALRESYARLADLRARLGPFDFPVTPDDISTLRVDPLTGKPVPALVPGVPKYRWLADQYGAAVAPPPADLAPLVVTQNLGGPPGGRGNYYVQVPFTIPDGYRATNVDVVLHANADTGVHFGVEILGTDYVKPAPQDDQTFPRATLMSSDPVAAHQFLRGATGPQTLALVFLDANSAIIELEVGLEPMPESVAVWRDQVWQALHDAAQARYYAEQQQIGAEINELEAELESVDTLTLRREESEEIMKNVLRFILGPDFDFMPDSVRLALQGAGADVNHGVSFTGNKLGMGQNEWTTVSQYEDVVRFVNQAIEWENVVTFLYSYFWDIPQSWDFIRNIRHPDAARQAFLRSGSARVVLTVRKGWEQAWVRFAEGGFEGAPIPSDHPYLTVAQEVAAYDDHNYPGIPPANPGKSTVHLEDSVYTTSAAAVSPSSTPVTLTVESNQGFVVGLPVVIDSVDNASGQELQLVTDIPDPTHLTVARLDLPHGADGASYPVVQPGEKGTLIAEWNEYTPTSGTDIAVTSDLSTIA